MWLRFYWDSGSGREQDELIRELEKAQIPRSCFDSPLDSGPGLVLFRGREENLPAFLRDVSQAGRIRVLVVSLDTRPLPSRLCWHLLAAGAADVIEWTAQPDPASAIAARLERWEQVEALIQSSVVRENLIGTSPRWIALLRRVVEAACYSTGPVLLLGPSGTGKELLARLIHTLDKRPQKRELIIADCTTIVPELSGSEFFGHERGAFTGAVAAREGAFALADGGTLFLDEAGDLPPALQAQLLRVIQEGKFKPVGGNKWYDTNFRLISATNRDLPREVEEGRFRADLYYRLAGAVFRVPSLAERVEDAIPLAEHFLAAARGESGAAGFDDAVKDYLLARDYPGNVRDLRQLVFRMTLRHAGPGHITVGDIPEDERPAAIPDEAAWHDGSLELSIRRALLSGAGLKEIGKVASDIAIRVALQDSGGNLQQAARRLQVTDRALQMRRAAGKQDGRPDESSRTA